jgi:hypothetical protein
VTSAPPPERGRADWRQELDRRLASGDVAGALEALWWWFAREVASEHVDASWTSHELLARCGRRELAPLATALDRLLYGAERPDVSDLLRFRGRIEEALA